MKNSEQKNQEIANFGFVALGHNYREKPLGSIVYDNNKKDKTETIAEGSSNFYDPSSKVAKDTISGIGSITKQFTAAALLKLWDNEITKKPDTKLWFPKGIDSSLEGFMPALKEQYPNCINQFKRMEQEDYYSQITLRDLLNHTHGLGARKEEKTADLVTKSGANPLAFSAIANTTVKRKDEVYGKCQYGNFGYDLAGMIIEIVAKDTGVVNEEVAMDGEAFDTALHKLVLDLNGLTNTYTQTDTKISYQKNSSKFAMGYFIGLPNEVKEIEAYGTVDQCQKAFNLISDTRAAGGIKSTVEDLAKFAPLYMKGEMFTNDLVKQTVLDRQKGAKMPEDQGNEPDDKYHLAIQRVMKTMIGHSGGELTYKSNLAFNPKTSEIRVELKLTENLIDYVTREIIKQSYPDDYKKMETIKADYNWGERCKKDPHNPHDDDKYFPFMEKLIEDVKKTPVPEGQIGILALVEKYIETKKQISEMPRNYLSKNRDGIILEMVKSGKPSSSPQKAFVGQGMPAKNGSANNKN